VVVDDVDVPFRVDVDREQIVEQRLSAVAVSVAIPAAGVGGDIARR